MKILNKNSTGSRSRALTEREVMQELTPGDKNYGKIAVGTDGTYEGEVLIGKDSDVQNTLANIDATHPFNGYVGSKKDMRFETSTNNILKVANMQEQYIVDGKVVDILGEELVVNGDFSEDVEITNTSHNLGIDYAVKLYQVSLSISNITADVSFKTRRTTAYYDTHKVISENGFYTFFIDSHFAHPEINYNGLIVIESSSSFVINNISVREISAIDLNITNDRTGFNGEGNNSFVPHVHVVGFDPISTGSITGNRVATDAQIGTILDNIPAQTANTRIKCRVKSTTDGIKVEILDKSDSDAVVRIQTVNGTGAETLTFTLPVNNDGYKVKATKITNDGVDSDDADERIDVTAEVSTGLVVDGKVKRGDYVVVDKEELVTNGTFEDVADGEVGHDNGDGTVDGWEDTQYDYIDLSVVGGELKVYITANTKAAIHHIDGLVAGVKYSLSFDAYMTQGDNYQLRLPNTVENTTILYTNSSKATHSIIFTATEGFVTFMLRNTADVTTTFYTDNISVQIADDTFKAIEDTDDGESLSSSKFKPADYISNQVFVGMKDDGTYTYDVLMNDAYAKESTTETLTNNGYASLGGGLFSKGSDVITPIGRWQTLNKGAYHPMLSPFSCVRHARTKGSTNGNASNKWYESAVFKIAENTADLFTVSADGGSLHDIYESVGISSSGGVGLGRPDSKFFDIVYPSQWLDMRYSSTKTNLPELASKEFSDGVSGKGGVCDAVGMIAAIETLGSSTQTKIGLQKKNFTTFPTYLYGTTGYHEGQAFVFKDFNTEDAGNWYLNIDRTIDLVIEKDVFFTKQLPITQVGEQFVTRAYCDPSLYPQILKDKLANEQVVAGVEPALIDQNGNNITPAGQTEFLLCNTKAKKVHNVIVSTNPEEDKPTYSSETVVADYVENKITQTLNTGDLALVSSTDSIPVATIQDSKQTEYVLEKYVATNSNEISLGNNITSLIGVGTGTGASETNTIGNVIVDTDGLIVTEPSHKTITLDNSGDKASKAFLTIASDDNNELYAQWMIEELASGWDGTSTFEDDTTTELTIDKVYQEQTSKLLYRALADKITVSDTATWSNPFDGDSGEFEQLTNGVATDVNGNTIRTIIASTPLNLLKDV